MINGSDISINDTNTNTDTSNDAFWTPLTIMGVCSTLLSSLCCVIIRRYFHRRAAKRRNLLQPSQPALTFPQTVLMGALGRHYSNYVGPEDSYDRILRNHMLALIHGLEGNDYNFIKKEIHTILAGGKGDALKQVNRLCSELGLIMIKADRKILPINAFRKETFDKVANLLLSHVGELLNQRLSGTARFFASLIPYQAARIQRRYQNNLAIFTNEEKFITLVTALKPKLEEIYTAERTTALQTLKQIPAITALSDDVMKIILNYDTPVITPLWNIRREENIGSRENSGTAFLSQSVVLELAPLDYNGTDNDEATPPPPPPDEYSQTRQIRKNS